MCPDAFVRVWSEFGLSSANILPTSAEIDTLRAETTQFGPMSTNFSPTSAKLGLNFHSVWPTPGSATLVAPGRLSNEERRLGVAGV